MTPKQARLGVDLFTGLVIASVALALANLTWRLQGYHGVEPAAAPVAQGGGEMADIRPMIALAPFGSALSVSGEGGDTSVRLRAIFLSTPMEASVALIAGADGKVASYGVGQAVGGGVIETIQAEQIVLRLANGQRVIGFQPDGASQPASSAGAMTAPTAIRTIRRPNSGAEAVRALIPIELQGNPPPSPQSAPPASSAGPSSSGLRIGTTPPPALAAAGIRPGDVIERVNGTAVNSATSERELVASAMAAGSARVELLRGGQRISLTVPVR